MQGPTSHFYYSQRLRLHYVDWGNETAPPLLLVHGGRDHCGGCIVEVMQFGVLAHIFTLSFAGRFKAYYIPIPQGRQGAPRRTTRFSCARVSAAY